MSDLSQAFHKFEDLITGKTDFSGMVAGEGAILAHRIAQAPAAAQPFLNLAYEGFKAGASKVVGLGESALGGFVAASSDSQATTLLNIMSAAGIPTNGILTYAEHAALVAVITGLKADLDRMHIVYATPAPAATASAAAVVEPTVDPAAESAPAA